MERVSHIALYAFRDFVVFSMSEDIAVLVGSMLRYSRKFRSDARAELMVLGDTNPAFLCLPAIVSKYFLTALSCERAYAALAVIAFRVRFACLCFCPCPFILLS